MHILSLSHAGDGRVVVQYPWRLVCLFFFCRLGVKSRLRALALYGLGRGVTWKGHLTKAFQGLEFD